MLVLTSSSYIIRASSNGDFEFNTRSTAQARFTAVGLASLISAPAFNISSPERSANTTPNAAATPIAGAPRTFIVLIALITSL